MPKKYLLTKPLRLKPDMCAVIRAARGEKTMLECASKAGIRESHWSTIENHIGNKMSLIIADRVAFALDLTLDQLFLSPVKKGKK